ncbi:PREDICTED: protein YIPF5-like isoform X2 [Nicrophorus vespilloides]|uniref:Protein YIPF5-like isoform X2 n=1 Tax=Nicrophorus vespilloides TaxID=110193 RepID=A0ABM1MCL9_NICVS|nr:PREDICTED: protein YIPF5-like isoform X2 [Nicrophorus vespilloides]
MSGFTNDNETYWSQQQGDPQRMQNPYYNPEADYSNLQSQQLDFQSFSEEQKYAGQSSQFQYPEMFTPMPQTYAEEGNDNEFDEPPLLEELEIYPDRILEKTIAVLRPFRSECLTDDAEFLAKQTDLAGPVAFCLLLACCLFISGNKAPFGYIYVLSVISCFLMYVLLSLMTNSTGIFTLSSVASILGYCLLPIVGLSIIGVFSTLHGNFGIILAILVISWSSISASRLFCAMSKDYEQRPLIAYPCALVYGVFALLVVF